MVEQDQLGAASACFEQALLLRQQRGEPRGIVSTRSALEALAVLGQQGTL